MKKVISIATLVILLFGCANSAKSDLSRLKSKPVCCANLSDISFASQQINKLTSFDLKKQPIRIFNKAKSPFIAIEKPNNSRFAQVFSYANGAFVQTATLVYPELILFVKCARTVSTPANTKAFTPRFVFVVASASFQSSLRRFSFACPVSGSYKFSALSNN